MVTTTKAFNEWNEVFPHAACTVTLVERLIHRAEIIEIEGASYRLKEAKERKQEKAKSRKPNRADISPRPSLDQKSIQELGAGPSSSPKWKPCRCLNCSRATRLRA